MSLDLAHWEACNLSVSAQAMNLKRRTTGISVGKERNEVDTDNRS